MNFIEMRDRMIAHFDEMTGDGRALFMVDLNKDEFYELYQNSYPAGKNMIYRKRREYDCSCCRGFIKNIGNVITIHDGVIDTVWNFRTDDDVYQPVLEAMDAYVRSREVAGIYLSVNQKIGCHHNFEQMMEIGPHRWDHFYLELPEKYVVNKDEIGGRIGDFNTLRNVFRRGLEELTIDSLECILELCNSNTLYKGQEWIYALTEFRKLKMKYEALPDGRAKELFLWEYTAGTNPVVTGIRNTVMGQLLTRVSEGEGLDSAVAAYEHMTAPNNYKRSKPLYTRQMLEAAQKKLEEEGLLDALPRRHATLDDITVNDILFVNRDAAKRVAGAADLFGQMAKKATDRQDSKQFSHVDEIPVGEFISRVLPAAKGLEVWLDNTNSANLMSLIAPQNPGVKSMFKWGNNFTWAYRGNMTDSMKERVKQFGGAVDGDLRFSIQWNEDGRDDVDVDAHCLEPSGYEIYFNNKRRLSPAGGMLDVDIIQPSVQVEGKDKTAVENITYANRRTMRPGIYRFFVHQYSGSARSGFRAEIEFDGHIYRFDYPHAMRCGEDVNVAEVVYRADGTFGIRPKLATTTASVDVWGLKTNEFVPVSVMCWSPNYWSSVEFPVGHKHLFFLLQGCRNDENPSGIFNEFLVQEFNEHRRVMEALGEQLRVEYTEDQLSGLGFAMDKRAEVIVRVTGQTQRVMKVRF